MSYKFLKYRKFNHFYCVSLLGTGATAHPANMQSLHSTASLAAAAWSRANQQGQAASATLPVSYSAFICVETLEINGSGSIFSIKREKRWSNLLKTSHTLWEAHFNFRLIVWYSVLPASVRSSFGVCVLLSKAEWGLLLLWSGGVQLCRVAQSDLFSLEAFFAGHMIKSVRQKGRVTNAKKKRRDLQHTESNAD